MPCYDWLIDLMSFVFHPHCDEIKICLIVDFKGLKKFGLINFLNSVVRKGSFSFLSSIKKVMLFMCVSCDVLLKMRYFRITLNHFLSLNFFNFMCQDGYCFLNCLSKEMPTFKVIKILQPELAAPPMAEW